MKVKVPKKASKFAVKRHRHKKFAGNYQKKVGIQQSTFNRVRIYKDFTLYLSSKSKLYYRDVSCKLLT